MLIKLVLKYQLGETLSKSAHHRTTAKVSQILERAT